LAVISLFAAVILSCRSNSTIKKDETLAKVTEAETTAFVTEHQPCAFHEFGEWEKVPNPHYCYSYTARQRCVVCGFVNETVVWKTIHVFGEWETVAEPTCSSCGRKMRRCSFCSAYEEESIPSLEHTLGEWTVNVSPSCTKGTERATCSVCGDFVTKEIAPTEEHVYSIVGITKGKEITIGSANYSCNKCRKSKVENNVCAAKDPDTGIVVEAKEKVFAVGTLLEFSKVSSLSVTHQKIETALAGKGYWYTAYDVNFTNNGAPFVPQGDFILYFPLVSSKVNFKIGSDNLLVFFLDSNGELKEVEHTYGLNSAMVTGNVGTYVVAEVKPEIDNWTKITNYNYISIFCKQPKIDGGPGGLGGVRGQIISNVNEAQSDLRVSLYDYTVTNEYYAKSVSELFQKYDESYFTSNRIIKAQCYSPSAIYRRVKEILVKGDKMEVHYEDVVISGEETEKYCHYGYIIELPASVTTNIKSVIHVDVTGK